jgi:hypothetical protein
MEHGDILHIHPTPTILLAMLPAPRFFLLALAWQLVQPFGAAVTGVVVAVGTTGVVAGVAAIRSP